MDALKKPHYEVSFCEDPFEAIPRLETESFELILCDIKMPGVSGLVLVEELRKQNILVPVLFITGNLTEESSREILRLKAVGLVEKPFRLAELRERVNRFFAGQ